MGGQRLIVLPGETIPSDGQVIEGAASVDLSAMTGETTPVQVSAEQGSTAVGGARRASTGDYASKSPQSVTTPAWPR